MDLANPALDFVKLSGGLGVESHRVDTAEQLADVLDGALGQTGPHLIEAILPPGTLIALQAAGRTSWRVSGWRAGVLSQHRRPCSIAWAIPVGNARDRR